MLYKKIMVMFLKALGVICVLVMIVAVLGAVINPGKAREFKDDLRK